MKMKVTLTSYQKDILKEAANRGAGNASSLLSKITGKTVNIVQPQVEVVPFSKLSSLITGPKEFVVGSAAMIKGEIQGSLLTLFPKKSGCLMTDLLEKNKSGTTKIFQPKEQEQIKDLGKRVSQSFLDTFGRFLGFQAKIEVVSFVSTFGESIADFVLMNIGSQPKEAILLKKVSFNVEESNIKGRFIVIMATGSISTLLGHIKNT